MIEYQVRPVTRYVVTRYEAPAGGTTGSSTQRGEYSNAEVAYEVACALARADQERLGLQIGDMGVIFPAPIYSNVIPSPSPALAQDPPDHPRKA